MCGVMHRATTTDKYWELKDSRGTRSDFHSFANETLISKTLHLTSLETGSKGNSEIAYLKILYFETNTTLTLSPADSELVCSSVLCRCRLLLNQTFTVLASSLYRLENSSSTPCVGYFDSLNKRSRAILCRSENFVLPLELHVELGKGLFRFPVIKKQ